MSQWHEMIFGFVLGNNVDRGHPVNNNVAGRLQMTQKVDFIVQVAFIAWCFHQTRYNRA